MDWRTEVDAARRIRRETETASRTPEALAEFRHQAHGELGAAGVPSLAAKTEQLRSRWVDDRMAEAGVARASSLGFPSSGGASTAPLGGELASFPSPPLFPG